MVTAAEAGRGLRRGCVQPLFEWAETHGSIFELLKVVGPLTDPTAHGGSAQDAFHLVLPSYPGYGFSGKPKDTGLGPARVGCAWDELMRRLGYEHYVSQGGDCGAIVSEAMAAEPPAGLLGIHVNMPATVPPDVAKLLRNGEPVPRRGEGCVRTARCLLHEGSRLCGDHG